MATNARKSFYLFILVSCSLLAGVLALARHQARQFVRRPRLPKQISNETFSTRTNVPTKCYSLLGCINLHPEGPPQEPTVLNLRFHFYTRNWDLKVQLESSAQCDDTKCLFYPYNLSDLRALNVTQDKKVFFLTAGFFAKEENKWQTRMKNRLLELDRDACIVLVSWTGGNHGFYETAVRNTRIVGRSISALIYYLGQVKHIDSREAVTEYLSNVHLIGHSLGAHISSQVGKDFAGKIGRITGLDPAGPNFNGLARVEKLDKNDARIVDVFHTDAGLGTQGHLGHEEPLGHLDFYVNGGSSIQPGCFDFTFNSGFKIGQALEEDSLLACSHKRASLFMISLIELEIGRLMPSSPKDRQLNRFWAYRAESFKKFQQGASFGSLCPQLASFNVDSRSSDMDSCMVPMDLLTSVEDYREELKLMYNVDFDAPDAPSQRLFFETTEKEPFLTDHDFIQLQLNNRSTAGVEYKIKLMIEEQEFKMRAGSLDDGAQTRLLIPYLSPIPDSKRNLDLIEIQDFYLNGSTSNTKELIRRVCQILPREIRVEQVDAPRSWIRFWDQVDAIDKLELVAVQPLRKLDRILVATYSAGDKDPKLVILNEGDDIPEDSIWDAPIDSKESLLIDTIYIGPKRTVTLET